MREQFCAREGDGENWELKAAHTATVTIKDQGHDTNLRKKRNCPGYIMTSHKNRDKEGKPNFKNSKLNERQCLEKGTIFAKLFI